MFAKKCSSLKSLIVTRPQDSYNQKFVAIEPVGSKHRLKMMTVLICNTVALRHHFADNYNRTTTQLPQCLCYYGTFVHVNLISNKTLITHRLCMLQEQNLED